MAKDNGDPRLAYAIQEGVDGQAIPCSYDDLVRKSTERQQYTSAQNAVEQGTLPATVVAPFTQHKGDVITNNGTSQQNLPVGSQNQVLQVDSAATNGIKWATLLSAKGDILTYSGTAFAILPVSALRDSALIVDSDAANGIRWSDKYWVPNKFRRLCTLQAQNNGAPIYSGWSNSTGLSASTGSVDSDGGWLQYTTAVGLNANEGHQLTVANGELVRTVTLPALYAKVKTTATASDLQNVRLWIVCYSGAGGSIATTTAPTASMFGWRFDTGAGDTTWKFYTANGTGAAGTATDTGITPAVSTAYKFGAVFDSTSSCRVFVNETLTNTVSATLPASADALVWWLSVTNLSAGTTRAIKWNKMVCEME